MGGRGPQFSAAEETALTPGCNDVPYHAVESSACARTDPALQTLLEKPHDSALFPVEYVTVGRRYHDPRPRPCYELDGQELDE